MGSLSGALIFTNKNCLQFHPGLFVNERVCTPREKILPFNGSINMGRAFVDQESESLQKLSPFVKWWSNLAMYPYNL